MKINKACDLSSISVLPPHSRNVMKFRRRSGVSCSLPEMSSTLKLSQAPSQQQQQRSQQSFSQGISSQHNTIFSQFSQNSQDDTMTNDQLVVSQERENSVRRFSGLPPVNNSREESQMPRSSTSLIRKWGSGVSEQRSQMSEEFERRIGTIESSLSRFGIMMESLQSDIMQVHKGTKEIAMDMESIRQKLNAQDNSLQIINKGQEDIKSSLQGELKSVSDQLNQNKCRQNSQDISILLSNLQENIRIFMLNLRNDLSTSFTNEMQALGCKLKAMDQKNPTPTILPPKAVSFCTKPQGVTAQKNPQVNPKVQLGTQIPKVEMGTWNSVKREKVSLENKDYSKGHKYNSISHTEPEREFGVVIESDEEFDGGFAFFIGEKETGRYSIEKAKEETERILRKARRRKRKLCNTIIIN